MPQSSKNTGVPRDPQQQPRGASNATTITTATQPRSPARSNNSRVGLPMPRRKQPGRQARRLVPTTAAWGFQCHDSSACSASTGDTEANNSRVGLPMPRRRRPEPNNSRVGLPMPRQHRHSGSHRTRCTNNSRVGLPMPRAAPRRTVRLPANNSRVGLPMPRRPGEAARVCRRHPTANNSRVGHSV